MIILIFAHLNDLYASKHFLFSGGVSNSKHSVEEILKNIAKSCRE